MGKKRSKTSKQKQAQAVSKTSRKFGVLVSKGGGREKSVNRVLDRNSSQKSSLTHATNTRAKPLSKKGWSRPKNNQEVDDFVSEMNSLQERQHQTTKSPKPLSWTEPTLIVNDADKSTHRLVEEATSKVKALNEIGAQPRSKLQQLAVQHRATEWTTIEETSSKPQNAFEALADNSDDDIEDEGWDVDKEERRAPLFQFTAPSFTVPIAHQRNNGEYDDDDLWRSYQM